MGAVAPGLPPRLPATAHFGAARCPWMLQDKGPRIQSLWGHWGDGPHPRSGGWPCYQRCSLFIPLAPFIALKKTRLKHHVLGGLQGGLRSWLPTRAGCHPPGPSGGGETQRCWRGGPRVLEGGASCAKKGVPVVPRGVGHLQAASRVLCQLLRQARMRQRPFPYPPCPDPCPHPCPSPAPGSGPRCPPTIHKAGRHHPPPEPCAPTG